MEKKYHFMTGIIRKRVMKSIRKKLGFVLFSGGLAVGMAFAASPVEASADIAAAFLPSASDNLNVGLRSSSGLVATDEGYMRVFYDGTKIGIEYYNDSFEIQGKQFLDMELSRWGGFYAGSDAYYLVEGQDNTDEDDMAEVLRVIKYDAGWNRIGAASITGDPRSFGAQVRDPFDEGSVRMTECNGMLYIVTGHEGYVDPAYNHGHQGFLMIAVDETSMSGKIVESDLFHSFAQYIDCRDSDLYVLEQSEGGRCTKLSRYNTEDLKDMSELSVLEYGGSRTSEWAVACYASVDGIAVSSDNVLGLGTSIDQSLYDDVSVDTPHNIYLTVTPVSDFSEEATTVKWLTNYGGSRKSFLGTKITKVNDNRFMVSWEEFGTSRETDTEDSLSASILHYIFVDGNGEVISGEFTEAAPISDCQPILKGSDIVYYASNANMVNFYSINAETGAFSKRIYRVAGENAVWDLKNNVLTISGRGAMTVDPEAHFRYPRSSASGIYSFSSDENAWMPVRDRVKKIIIDGGISSIPEEAFIYFDQLTEVEIQSGVKSIGKKAFYGCEALKKIAIPESVTSIGEDFLWTGYWTGDDRHMVTATIYAPENSYAGKYAKEQGIHNVSGKKEDSTGSDVGDNASNGAGNGTGNNTGGNTGSRGEDGTGSNAGGSTGGNTINISKAKISGIKSGYAYTGRALRPDVTVKIDGKKLKKGTDYTVSYANNKKTGRAAVKIKGVHRYRGTIVKTFKIVPKRTVLLRLTSPESKTIKVTWKKDPQADGYQIKYAGNSIFTSGKHTVEVNKKSSVTKKISKLVKNKKYYVRVRAYKKINGKKCYGSWSKSMKVRCK